MTILENARCHKLTLFAWLRILTSLHSKQLELKNTPFTTEMMKQKLNLNALTEEVRELLEGNYGKLNKKNEASAE